ncbi:MAG: hypothetical protein M3415_08560 [Actinomycetota bacterium]|nr:hypothetical protein [Actinomycetota bacterium]
MQIDQFGTFALRDFAQAGTGILEAILNFSEPVVGGGGRSWGDGIQQAGKASDEEQPHEQRPPPLTHSSNPRRDIAQ